MNPSWLIPVGRLYSGHDTIIDTRTPAEFAEDHVPGAINCPVLSNEERVRVGTLYKQVSPFEARKVGAALIARNIADHLENCFHDKPKSWRPLVYCWRGGQRSGAMQIILRQVGWAADKLDGGYKAFRQHVMARTTQMAPQVQFVVIGGATGSAKTRILQSISSQGGQILDLETLAAHKGSVLGPLPDRSQPSQKQFETLLWHQLEAFDPAEPVFVEAESRKIGALHLPESVIETMRAGLRVEIDASPAARVAFLLQDYDYALRDPSWIQQRLARLAERRGHQLVESWQTLAEQRAWPALVQQLLELHYDPLYRQSQPRNFTGPLLGEPLRTNDLTAPAINGMAARILQSAKGGKG